ncbi:dienelactone hydrolase [Zhengella mangrovi]|uniref:Dienelactone hydrolase n=1 Tax=Zhengella mangrovi TaxID=1982044 RepID=A0A2G1QKI6_9HYPH|nr:dienelactone hydrolase family protein [Zhengella mangrovi]PHP65989.1 dienelactone hydrolase [Zhengella mangrovi]
MKRRLGFAILASLVALPALAGDRIAYAVNGKPFEGYFASAGKNAITVVILPTWNGISDYEKDRAQMLADEGYNAFAADLHGEGNLPKTMEDKQSAHDALFAARPELHAMLRSAIGKAQGLGGGKIVLLGYSMGGGAAMELVRSGLGSELGVAGYAVFSGRVTDPENRMIPEGIAPIFVAHGAEDRRVPGSGLRNFADDLDLAGVEHTIEIYPGAGHLFSAFGFPNYDQQTERRSWAALLKFLGGLAD